jgi:hypothetical protein
MNSTLARRLALTLATAGIAVLSSVAVAPAASAAPAEAGLTFIDERPGKVNGPDAFIVTEHGRVPVFFCDDSGKLAENCTPTGDGDSGRF